MSEFRVLRTETLFDGFARVEQTATSFLESDGSRSKPVVRQTVERGDSSAILARDRSTGSVLLVRQFRSALVRHAEPWSLEIVAGKIDPGESPMKAAARELEEETGLRCVNPTSLGSIYPSPGVLSEAIYLFQVDVGPESRVGKGGGVGDERVEALWMDEKEALRRAIVGEIRDAKTVVALLRASGRGR